MLRCVLRAGPDAPRKARHIAAGFQGLDGQKVEDLKLVVSELVTNAVTHAGLKTGAPIRLRLEREQGRLRLEVDDGDGLSAAPERMPRSRAGGGRGLAIVSALSERWEAHGGRVVVWLATT
jgi:anti-sigma regulatory factor (Ser/Thr protein kinase)